MERITRNLILGFDYTYRVHFAVYLEPLGNFPVRVRSEVQAPQPPPVHAVLGQPAAAEPGLLGPHKEGDDVRVELHPREAG